MQDESYSLHFYNTFLHFYKRFFFVIKENGGIFALQLVRQNKYLKLSFELKNAECL